MLRPSTRAQYALRAMIELARHEGNGPVRLRRVAEAQRISPKYLEQLTIPLRRAGLVSALRGPSGGYALARPAQEIMAREVVEAVEGSLSTVTHVPDDAAGGHTRVCAAQDLWSRVGDAIATVLAGTSLADLRDAQQAAEAQQVSRYQI